ncbi:uncharacterized protein LOC135143571 isoform X2 [Zophobas morio]
MNHLLFLLMSTLSASVHCMPVDHNSLSPSSLIITPFNTLGDASRKKIAQVINPKKAFPLVAPFPDSGRTYAALEHESLVGKADTAYGRLQEFVAGFYHPKPIVDTIQEHEKYGNDGGKTRVAATYLIGGLEGVSNILNTIVDVPFEVVNQFGRKLSETSAAVGAKLVGL